MMTHLRESLANCRRCGSAEKVIIVVDLKTTIGALRLSNPVIAASGTFGYGAEFNPFVDISRLGAISVKGLTLKPKDGNPAPRLVETSSGLLNSIGLENIGIDSFLKNALPHLCERGVTVIANINGEKIDDFVELTERLNGAKGISAIEVNISCPNVRKGGMQFGTDLSLTESLTSAVVNCSALPVIVKLSPNVTCISDFARACEAAGADALSLINTLLGMAVDSRTQRPILGNVFGGLSGPAIKPVALRMVWQVTDAVHIPVIGMGGIMNATDAIEFLLAGATAVSTGTVNLVYPSASLDIIDGIGEYLDNHDISDIKSIIGLAKIKNVIEKN